MPRYRHENGAVVNVPAEKGKTLGAKWSPVEKPAPKPRTKKSE